MLHVWADAGAAGADFVGIPGAAGKLSPEKKPQFGGIFTDLKVPAQPGLSARVDVDTRFILAPTTLKTLAMILGVLAVLTVFASVASHTRPRGVLPDGHCAAILGAAPTIKHRFSGIDTMSMRPLTAKDRSKSG